MKSSDFAFRTPVTFAIAAALFFSSAPLALGIDVIIDPVDRDKVAVEEVSLAEVVSLAADDLDQLAQEEPKIKRS